MPEGKKEDNKISKVNKLTENKQKNSKIIQKNNQKSSLQKKEISEDENSRFISLAKLEWQKLKLLVCPDEELTIPEFEIYSSIYEDELLDFNDPDILYDCFRVGKLEWQSGRIEIDAELVKRVVNYMLCDSNNLGQYRLFKDILTHAIAKQLFLHKLQRSNEKYKNMHFDSSEFEDKDEVIEIVRTYQHICWHLDKILELQESRYFGERYCCHWPFNRRNKEYYHNTFDPQLVLYETLKVPSESGWLIEHPDSGFIERLDLYVMNHPQFF